VGPHGDRVLPLAALLIAGETPAPRLLGADPIEFQLRRARAAGVGHAVIYAERVTSPLLAIVDRLRSEGLSVDIARTVADAAEMIHPDEVVLLMAHDLVVAPERLAAVANSEQPVLLCVRDEPANKRFELIDPTARWTGIARLDGGLLRRTAAMIGDWDLGSTLMRRAAQEGAAKITLTPEEVGTDIIVVDSTSSAQLTGRRLVAAAPVENAGWATRWLVAPFARVMARVAGDLSLDAQWATLIGFGLFGLSTACALAGWIVASLLGFVLAQICDVAGLIGTQAGAGTARWEKYRFPVRAAAAVVMVLAMGTTLTMRTAQWGCLVLAAVIVGATWLAMPFARDDDQMASWRSDPAGYAMIGLVGFAMGSPVAALAVSAVHAAISLGGAVRKALSGLARS
jgi:hypothetical protein